MNEKIALLPDEEIVSNLNNDKEFLILTTKRVRYDSIVWGNSNLISMTINSVASCGLITKSFPVLLILAAATFIGAFFYNFNNKWPIDNWIIFGTASVLVIAYFLTRRSVISVASNGGKVILMPIKNLKRDALVEFIDAVEREKLK